MFRAGRERPTVAPGAAKVSRPPRRTRYLFRGQPAGASKSSEILRGCWLLSTKACTKACRACASWAELQPMRAPPSPARLFCFLLPTAALANLSGWCGAEIQQFAFVGSSSSLHSEACSAFFRSLRWSHP
jgi:hypothetical protein